MRERFGSLVALPGSQSLVRIGDSGPVVYLRYSKLHPNGRTFYGFRDADLSQLDIATTGFIALLWDASPAPLILPWARFRATIMSSPVARDGQIKAQLDLASAPLLYLPRAGKHPVEPYIGWWAIEQSAQEPPMLLPSFSHSQVQTMLGSIGAARGFHIWVTTTDRSRLDWSIAPRFSPSEQLPAVAPEAQPSLRQIDVVWTVASTSTVYAAFEIEHTTPIYSGLLRFNDLFITGGRAESFSVVGSEERRDEFVRQLNRPTFMKSGLVDRCGFLTDADVFRWLHTES